MTYNVHRCVGTDGQASTDRIAEVIASQNADIVCLQELDVSNSSKKLLNQPEAIARKLNYRFHFSPVLFFKQGSYGNAVLSRYPLKCVHSAPLPALNLAVGRTFFGLWNPANEPRGALWTEIDLPDGTKLQVINTHLGLRASERRQQVQALLSPDWLDAARQRGRVLLCGDFNERPGSPGYRLLSSKLRDICIPAGGGRRQATFPTRFPLFKLDHLWTDSGCRVETWKIAKNALTRRASDHFPLWADLTWDE